MDHSWGNEFDQYPNEFLEMEDIQIPSLPNGENILMEPSEMNLTMLSTIHNFSTFNPQEEIPGWSEIPVLQSDHGEQMREFKDLDYPSHFQAGQICNVMDPKNSNFAVPLNRHGNSLSSVLCDSHSGDMYQLNDSVQQLEKGISQYKSYKRNCPRRNPVQREIHILAERQRREEMNEKFSLLRSIIPKLSKKDKTSIITEAIKHLLELEKKVKGLRALKTIKEKEAKLGGNKSYSSTARHGFAGKVESSRLNRSMEMQNKFNQDIGTFSRHFGEGNRDGRLSEIEVQNFGRQAVIRILCPWRSGLVLQTHKVLENCRVDVLQSTMATNGGNMVYYLTIECIEGTPSIDDLMNALEQALSNV